MALGKPSKTQKPTAEPKVKAVSARSKTKASQISSAASAGDVVEAAPLKTRKTAVAVSNGETALQNGKSLAAAAGSLHSESTNGTMATITREAVAELAYTYWAERGYAHGYADEDWARAEAELTASR